MAGKKGRSGAPFGNKNSAKPRLLSDALRKAIIQDRKRLEAIVDALLNKAATGDVQAIKEFTDRLEGKPAQRIEGNGPNGAIKFVMQKGDDKI